MVWGFRRLGFGGLGIDRATLGYILEPISPKSIFFSSSTYP